MRGLGVSPYDVITKYKQTTTCMRRINLLRSMNRHSGLAGFSAHGSLTRSHLRRCSPLYPQPLGKIDLSSPSLVNQASIPFWSQCFPAAMKRPTKVSLGYLLLFVSLTLYENTCSPLALRSCTHSFLRSFWSIGLSVIPFLAYFSRNVSELNFPLNLLFVWS